MSEYYEIAYAAKSKRVCLFTGTGFSKAVSKNKAPTWVQLLTDLCDKTNTPDALKASLFPPREPSPLSLEEAAQVIALKLESEGLNIKEEAAKLVRKIKLSGDNSEIEKFLGANSFRVITTNYDKLMEQLSGEEDCQSLTPGLPVPRSDSRVKVYHVHGSIDVPENMVVTSEDYFRFLNAESYFSRKLSTILHENTVVILGYSLGDTNLKAIMNDYRTFARDQLIGSNVFFVSRSSVAREIKDYYAYCYGIRVIDSTSIHDFFGSVNEMLASMTKASETSIANIKKVAAGEKKFTEKFLRLEESFFEIVASIGAAGLSLRDTGVKQALAAIIEKKVELTGESGAWEQYEHLARWLVYIATILELKGTPLESQFISAVQTSMTTMSKQLRLGYSWHAHSVWASKWDSIISSNRTIIKKHVEDNTAWPDALAIVAAG